MPAWLGIPVSLAFPAVVMGGAIALVINVHPHGNMEFVANNLEFALLGAVVLVGLFGGFMAGTRR
ncbi:MAG: hypothetical protein ACYC2Y_05300 [Armatimonadota bacterium]